jgi:hypothetical protein
VARTGWKEVTDMVLLPPLNGQDENEFPHAEKSMHHCPSTYTSRQTFSSNSSRFPLTETIADHLRKYEALFTRTFPSIYLHSARETDLTWAPSWGLTVTPQRMRMIVHAFEETLDKGLKRYGEVVVSIA